LGGRKRSLKFGGTDERHCSVVDDHMEGILPIRMGVNEIERSQEPNLFVGVHGPHCVGIFSSNLPCQYQPCTCKPQTLFKLLL